MFKVESWDTEGLLAEHVFIYIRAHLHVLYCILGVGGARASDEHVCVCVCVRQKECECACVFLYKRDCATLANPLWTAIPDTNAT